MRPFAAWEKIVGFAGDEWFPSRLSFGKFKGRLCQEAREDAELRAWLEDIWVEAEMKRWPAGLVAFQHPEIELYQRLVEASRNRLADRDGLTNDDC